MFRVRTQNSITGKPGKREAGYCLQWVGENKPSYIVGPQGTCCWYKYKKDAIARAQELNK